MPITWKNVSGSGGASQAAVGAQLFEQSREAMNDGFNGFQDILQQNRDQERAAWLQGKENNTQNFLDQLSQFRTPEELAAAQASGAIPDTAQYGAQINREQVRGALEARLQTLQDASLRNQEYTDNQFEVAVRPLIQQYNDFGDDFAGKAAFLKQHDLGSERELKFMDEINARKLALSQESRAVNQDARSAQARAEASALNAANQFIKDDEVTQLKKGRAVDEEIAQFRSVQQEEEKANKEAINQIATDLGINPNDISSSPPRLIEYFNEKLNEAGLSTVAMGQRSNDFAERIGLKYGDEFGRQAAKATKVTTDPTADMSPQELEQLKIAETNAISGITALETELEKEKQTNSLARDVSGIYETTEGIIGRIAEKTESPWERKALYKQVTAALERGEDPAVIDLAIEEASLVGGESAWYNPNNQKEGHFTDAVTRIKNDPRYAKQIEDGKLFREKLDLLNKEKLKIPAMQRKARAEKTRALGYEPNTSNATLAQLNEYVSRADAQRKAEIARHEQLRRNLGRNNNN